MINSTQASAALQKAIPGIDIQKQVEYNGKYIFLAQPPDPNEPPVLFSVDKSTSAVMDLVPWQVDDPLKLQELLMDSG